MFGLVWIAIGLILDFMFKIQHYVLTKCFSDVFSPTKSIFKRASGQLSSAILYILVWPLFIILALVLKLKEMDEDYEE
jgi:lipopolysaccharide/colanic/teichoic acid biosynthesis glycosyltransferase